MHTCFLCEQVMVPRVPPTCNNASLRRAFEGIQYATYRHQPLNVADYDIRLFQQQKVCLIKEYYNPEHPKISLTNSIETAIVQICHKYGLCPALWTFVEYTNMEGERKAYHEYDMIVLTNNDIEWKYLWHSDCKAESEPYSDALLISRIEQYRDGANTVL